MTYIRNPRDPLMWESDGVWNGKYMARDGTTHPTPEEALAKDKQIDAVAKGQQSSELVEKTPSASPGSKREQLIEECAAIAERDTVTTNHEERKCFENCGRRIAGQIRVLAHGEEK